MFSRGVIFAGLLVAALAMPVAAKTVSPAYVQTNLVTLHGGGNVNHDSQLSNPWGIAFAPGFFIWIADNNTGVSTLYDGTGTKNTKLVVTIPPGMGEMGPSNPTGMVLNPANSFVSGAEFDGAPFIFATENGTVAAWEAKPPNTFPGSATTVIDHSMQNAVYKGLAIGNDGGVDQLYVTNFHAGTVEVYSDSFGAPSGSLVANPFTDPNAIAGFAPFGIFNINGTLFVTYAQQNATMTDEVNAPGNGFIDEFGTDGHLIKRFATGGHLDSPWGIVMAPASGFGPFSGDLLVGNFGDGRLNAFDPATGDFLGTLTDSHGHDLVNPGLWGLQFGFDTAAGEPNLGNPDELFFTAGGAKQNRGTFGDIQFTDPPKGSGSSGGGMMY